MIFRFLLPITTEWFSLKFVHKAVISRASWTFALLFHLQFYKPGWPDLGPMWDRLARQIWDFSDQNSVNFGSVSQPFSGLSGTCKHTDTKSSLVFISRDGIYRLRLSCTFAYVHCNQYFFTFEPKIPNSNLLMYLQAWDLKLTLRKISIWLSKIALNLTFSSRKLHKKCNFSKKLPFVIFWK